jgi:hypothetical protein
MLRRIYDKHQDAPRKLILLNCAIARYFGTSEFYEALGWQDDFNPDKIKSLASERLRSRQRVFTGAYVITNQGISAPKEEVVTDIFLKGLWSMATTGGLCNLIRDGLSWERTVRQMAEIQGFGGTGFMAKEVTLDTMYFTSFWPDKSEDGKSLPSDYWSWTPIGPGARRGLQRLDMSPTLSCLLQVSDSQDTVYTDHERLVVFWPMDWGKLSPTDIQFGLCEFDKYERTRLGEGRPRSLFKPRKD